MELALLDNQRTLAAPGVRGATCPACGEPVIPKCGEWVIWHWAHEPDSTCLAALSGPETDWHRWWKTAVPPGRREVVIGCHVADAVAGDGVVCELQHSQLPAHQIHQREQHYERMRWIFDARDRGFQVEERGAGFSVHRPYSWPTIAECQRRVMLDLGEGVVISLEKINESGSYGWGFLYPYRTIRMWLAGPDYRKGWRT